jgi:hypothetical protein
MTQAQVQRGEEEGEYAPDSPMADFLDTNLANDTKYQYTQRLKIFFDSLQLHGNLDKQSREFLAQARKDRVWAQEGLKYFIRAEKKRAEEGEIAESTIRNFYKPVRLFCNIHDIELSWKKITSTIPTGRKFANDRAPTVEEIQRLIEYPDRRIKPLVLTMCSSGIRLGAWEYLKWKHIEPIRRVIDGGDNDGIRLGASTWEYLKWNHIEPIRDRMVVAAKITVYAGENEQYFSFITSEAFEALQEWMDFRRTSGEDINGESWLMRTVWDTTTTPKRSTIRSPAKMSEGAIKMLVGRALRSEGLRTALDMKVTRRYEFKSNHGFRKFFQTNAEPKMKSLDVMTLMGQDTGLAASYNKPTVEMLLVEYLKAVDNLTIDKTRTNQQQQEEKMASFAKNQQALAVDMQAKEQEIEGLRKQTQILSEQLVDVIEQQQQDAKSFDRKFEELLKIVDTRFHQDDATAFISGEISKMMPRRLTVAEFQKCRKFVEQLRNSRSSDNEEEEDID